MFSCGGNCERMFRWWGWSVGGGLSSNTLKRTGTCYRVFGPYCFLRDTGDTGISTGVPTVPLQTWG